MINYLVALIWPAGIAAILGVALALTRRPAELASSPGHAHQRRVQETSADRSSFLDATRASVRFVIISVTGAAVVIGVMSVLGLVVVYHGLTIDRPIFTWIASHQVHAMAAAMRRLTKIGDTWTTWGAAIAAAACLAATWRAKRWLPPVALACAIVIDHYATSALRHIFERPGPPTSPLGTYPSGGCDRVIVFYGMIGYLLWRELSGQRRTAIWVAAVVTALGFDEAYSRVYLSKHWFTDAVSGLLYGGLLLIVLVTAVRLVAGHPDARPSAPDDRGEAVLAAVPND